VAFSQRKVTLDTATSTTYTIEYNATDQAGNSATSTRQVIVGSGDEGLFSGSGAGGGTDGGETLVETNTATSTPETTEESIVVTEEKETATSTPETASGTTTPQT